MKKIFSILTLLCLASFAQADNIITFNFDGIAGDEASINSSFNNPALTPSLITRGAGLVANAGGSRFNASDWSTNDLALAVTNNDFFTFSISNIGFATFSVTNITVVSRRSSTGPTNIAIRGSHDGFGADLGTYSHLTNNTPATNSFNVSGVAGLQNVNAPVEFRIFGFSASSPFGTFGIGGVIGDDIIIEGSVSGGVISADTSTNIVTIVATQNASELGTNGVFTINSTGTNFPITVTYTLGGTATFTNDYDFLSPATSNSIVMSTSTTNIEIVPVNDGDTNEINPEDVTITLDANGTGWEADVPNTATVEIFATVVSNQPPVVGTGGDNITGFDLILKGGFKPGKTLKWKSTKGISPLKGPKGQIASTSNTVSSVAYALMTGTTNTNALTFVTAGVVKKITKGPLFKKKNVKATFKATKTTKLGIGIPAGTTSADVVIRVTGVSGTNIGSQFFTNTYTTVVK